MSSLEDWLKPAAVAATGGESTGGGTGGGQGGGTGGEMAASSGNPGGGTGASADLLPPDLGLGNLSAEDIKWVDLEFLDLASGPPASSDRNRNKNPTLGDNFPDIFFGDATFPSSLFNLDDVKPFGEPFGKDNALVDFEKNILDDLFPPTAAIDPAPEDEPRHQMHEEATSGSSSVVNGETRSGDEKLLGGFSQPEGSYSNSGQSNKSKVDVMISPKIETHQNAAASDSSMKTVIPGFGRPAECRKKQAAEEELPMDVLQLLSKNFETPQQQFSSSANPPPPLLPSVPQKRGKAPIDRIAMQCDATSDRTKVRVEPLGVPPGVGAADAAGIARTQPFRVDTAGVEKATKMIKPAHLERLPVFLDYLSASTSTTMADSQVHSSPAKKRKLEAEKSGAKPQATPILNHPPATAPVSKSSGGIQITELTLDKTHPSLHVLESHGIRLEGLTRATTEGGQRYWICPEEGCKKAYTRPSKLKIHLLSHRDVRPFACPMRHCASAFVTNSKLKRHLSSHRNSSKVPDENLSASGGIRRTFFCPEQDCGAKFAHAGNLRRHQRLLHQGGGEAKSSDVGEKKQVTPSSTTCEKEGCGRRFRKPSQLRAHFRKHTGARPYACTAAGCSWAFPTASKLRRHERSHSNIRQHVCHLCQKAYLRSEHLRNHLQSGHLAGASKNAVSYACAFPTCRGRFMRRSSLHHHLRIKHKNDPNNDKGWRCLVDGCSKQRGLFKDRKELFRHVTEHHRAAFTAPDPNSLLLNKPPAANDAFGLPQILKALEGCGRGNFAEHHNGESLVIDPSLLREADACVTASPVVIPPGSVLLLPSRSSVGEMVAVDASSLGGKDTIASFRGSNPRIGVHQHRGWYHLKAADLSFSEL